MDKSERTESTSTDSDMDVSEFEEQEDPKDYKPGDCNSWKINV